MTVRERRERTIHLIEQITCSVGTITLLVWFFKLIFWLTELAA